MIESLLAIVFLTLFNTALVIDALVYLTTPYEVRKDWPWWRYAPLGAIVCAIREANNERS